MRGISVYLSEELTSASIDWIERMRESGFTSIFTSLHIPEDDSTLYTGRLQQLGELAKRLEMELVADIAPSSLQALGKNWNDAHTLLEWGVTGLRVDYGVTPKQVADLSRHMMVALNASTLTETEFEEMLRQGLRRDHVEAWHNFYPRPETGLDRSWFDERNAWLHAQGIKVQAFIPGDEQLRSPLHETLPTLEAHRHQSPLSCYIDLQATIDRILIGDPRVSNQAMRQFQAYDERVIVLHATSEYRVDSLPTLHTNRMDPARDVIRSVESRAYGRPGDHLIQPQNTEERLLGSITMDNERYGRYAGELQVTKRDLPADERVNVIGRVIEIDRTLVQHIGPGGRFQIDWT
ncbi:DUF871 domain-containing protein [Exiguobacterium sp. B2(2022)]|uniref:DUF871 domain-containing protein n=1 Tax=Exiguobacterium sp. B2(2022) TaxID=2992755 RepID=UPI00237B2870|nr:MupG family TIM beta-alpha barrel fold protein [Exiguobacterium sp. B2(2022)]MDE0563285.1 MupG family TIM beta-alpha barrel fold protein [Exiguobacterium sp. B2(2022)]